MNGDVTKIAEGDEGAIGIVSDVVARKAAGKLRQLPVPPNHVPPNHVPPNHVPPNHVRRNGNPDRTRIRRARSGEDDEEVGIADELDTTSRTAARSRRWNTLPPRMQLWGESRGTTNLCKPRTWSALSSAKARQATQISLLET